MRLHKDNFFYKFRNDKEFQRLLKEEGERLDIAIQIAMARKKKRLSQVQLAKKVGMAQSQIARIERGNQNITIGSLSRITSALDLRIKLAA